jgi:hypothetical protein
MTTVVKMDAVTLTKSGSETNPHSSSVSLNMFYTPGGAVQLVQRNWTGSFVLETNGPRRAAARVGRRLLVTLINCETQLKIHQHVLEAIGVMGLAVGSPFAHQGGAKGRSDGQRARTLSHIRFRRGRYSPALSSTWSVL